MKRNRTSWTLRRKRAAPKVYSWQQRILGILKQEPGLTTAELAARYAPRLNPTMAVDATLHELLELYRRDLVQQHAGKWSPSLLALAVAA